MQVQSYLFFNGRCEEAAAFYGQAIGAKIEFQIRFKEGPNPETAPPEMGDKIMHMSLRIGETIVSCSDGRCVGKAEFQGFALTLTPPDVATGERLFNALADGGRVTMQLAKTFYATSFGMLVDRFGVMWMIMVE
jgi:PhnB protein